MELEPHVVADSVDGRYVAVGVTLIRRPKWWVVYDCAKHVIVYDAGAEADARRFAAHFNSRRLDQ